MMERVRKMAQRAGAHICKQEANPWYHITSDNHRDSPKTSIIITIVE